MSNPNYSKLLPMIGLGLDTVLAGRELAGPASYVQNIPNGLGGQTLSATSFGLSYLKGGINSPTSASGNYFTRFKIARGSGKPTIQLLWFVMSTGAEVAAGTNLSGEYVPLFVIGK